MSNQLEDRSYIRQNSGIANARKVSVVSVKDSDTQSVNVTDGFGEVLLSLSTSSFPAALTPDQATMLASQLRASAERVYNRKPEP